jgi:hypothetical protein
VGKVKMLSSYVSHRFGARSKKGGASTLESSRLSRSAEPGRSADDVARMEAFWDDRSWRDAACCTAENLFGWPEKQRNEVIAEAGILRSFRTEWASPARLAARSVEAATKIRSFGLRRA